MKTIAAIFAALGSLLSQSADAETDHSSIVTGVVSAMGPSVRQAGPNAPWIGSVALVAWRAGDGPVEITPLQIEHVLENSTEAQKRWMASLRSRTVVKVRIKGKIETKGLWPFAKFAESLGDVDDMELSVAADPILNPPDFVDAHLGRFAADQQLPGSFNGRATWLSEAVDLTLSTESRDELADCAATAKNMLKDARRWQSDAENKILETLYQLWVDRWRPMGAPILSKTAFLAKLTKPSLTVYKDGAFEMEFGDGELFEGHWILVAGSLDEGVEDANIAG